MVKAPFIYRFVLTALTALLFTSAISAQTKLLRFPDVSGDKVVFTYGGDLWIAATSGGNKTRITRATIEVNRDLREMSGMSAKAKAQDMGLRLANFKGVSKKLEEAFEEEGT